MVHLGITCTVTSVANRPFQFCYLIPDNMTILLSNVSFENLVTVRFWTTEKSTTHYKEYYTILIQGFQSVLE
jgi:hypothetical protein